VVRALVYAAQRQIMDEMLLAVRELGLNPMTLTIDGVMVRNYKDRDREADESAADHDASVVEFLRKGEERVKEKTGYSIRLEVQPMEVTEEHMELLRGDKEILTVSDAADFLLEQYPMWFVSPQAGDVLAFDEHTNTWSRDLERIVDTLMRRDFLLSFGRFQSDLHKQRCVLAKLRAIVPIDEKRLHESLQAQRLKLPFHGGYYDAEKREFVPGPNPELGFLGAVELDSLPERVENDVRQVRREVFEVVFKTRALCDYYVKALARALFGDKDKRGYFVLGPRNSGKTLQTKFFCAAFPAFVEIFNAENLLGSGGSSEDPEKGYKWMVPLATKRIAFSDELTMRRDRCTGRRPTLNSDTFKKLTGGDFVIARLLYNNSVKLIPHCTPFCLVEDAP